MGCGKFLYKTYHSSQHTHSTMKIVLIMNCTVTSHGLKYKFSVLQSNTLYQTSLINKGGENSVQHASWKLLIHKK
jgi:hypothetical protein